MASEDGRRNGNAARMQHAAWNASISANLVRTLTPSIEVRILAGHPASRYLVANALKRENARLRLKLRTADGRDDP